MSRRSHSTIEKLPTEVKSAIDDMLIDGIWPNGFCPDNDWVGKPRYSDCVDYCTLKGQTISESAMGRYGKKVKALSRMRNAGLIARETMKDLDGEKASQTQKACAEMITAHMIELVSDAESFNALDLKNISKAVKDCTAVAISADKYVRQQVEEKAKAAAERSEKKLTEAGVDRAQIQEIMDEFLGITK